MCTYVPVLACIHLYVSKSKDKDVMGLAEKSEKNFSLCSGNYSRSFRPFAFSFMLQDTFIKHPLRASTAESPGDRLKELSPEKEEQGTDEENCRVSGWVSHGAPM